MGGLSNSQLFRRSEANTYKRIRASHGSNLLRVVKHLKQPIADNAHKNRKTVQSLGIA